MTNPSAAIVAAGIVIAGVILGMTLPARSQAPANHMPDLQIGRFQIAGVPGHAYVLDTATGQVWEAFATTGSGQTDVGFKAPKIRPNTTPVREDKKNDDKKGGEHNH